MLPLGATHYQFYGGLYENTVSMRENDLLVITNPVRYS